MCQIGKRVETIVEGDLPEEEVVVEINTEQNAEFWIQELELNKQVTSF